jgi:hypothetical protein
MAHFVGDTKTDGTVYHKANPMWLNFWYDASFQEDRCVWKNRGELERYFIIVGALFCWTVIVPLAKLNLYLQSRKKRDHR